MEQKRTLLIGLDLDYDYTQICCYDEKAGEPVSIRVPRTEEKNSRFQAAEGEESLLIPTAIGVVEETKNWVFGEEALRLVRSGAGAAVPDLLERAESEEAVTLLTASFLPEELLERFLRRCLLLIRQQIPGQLIARLVITLPCLEKGLLERLGRALEKLGMFQDRVSFQSHGQSFGQFVLHQKREFWNGTVALLDYRRPGLLYSQYKINAKKRPALAVLEQMDVSDRLPCPREKSDQAFVTGLVQLAEQLFYRQQVVTVYATGSGFREEEKTTEALSQLCQGRRVFLGDNLYVRGACYYAAELQEHGGSLEAMGQEVLLLAEDCVRCEVSMNLFYRGRVEEAILCDPGMNWFEVDKTFDFILDETDCLEVVMRPVLGGTTVRESFYLDGLERRPRKMTRLRVRFRYEDRETLLLTAEDMGFGEWYPASGQTWTFRMNAGGREERHE